MSAHTPGPWKALPAGGGWRYEIVAAKAPNIGVVAEVYSEQNARLIAAAPDLLETLRALVEWGPLAESLDVAEFRVDVVNALAAIAKAEGR